MGRLPKGKGAERSSRAVCCDRARAPTKHIDGLGWVDWIGWDKMGGIKSGAWIGRDGLRIG
eukprot:7233797-Pyramimonas_sp.AAC.1